MSSEIEKLRAIRAEHPGPDAPSAELVRSIMRIAIRGTRGMNAADTLEHLHQQWTAIAAVYIRETGQHE